MGSTSKKSYFLAPVAFFHHSQAPIERSTSRQYARILSSLAGFAWTASSSDTTRWSLVTEEQLTAGDKIIGVAIQNATKQAPQSASMVVVDLRPPLSQVVPLVPPRAYHRLYRALKDLLDSREIRAHILLIVPELLDPEDFAYKGLAHLINAGQVSAISSSGQVWSKLEAISRRTNHADDPKSVSGDTLAAILRSDLSSIARQIQLKTVRRLGYFAEDTAQERVNRYYFDGQLCDDEITALLAEEILQVSGPEAPNVAHPDSMSDWFAGPLFAATYSLGCSSTSIADIRRRRRAPSDKSPRLLILPLIDSHKSAVAGLQVLRDKYPVAPLHVIAIYAVGEKSADGIGSTTVQVNLPDGLAEAVPIRYAAGVRQERVRSDALSPDIGYYVQLLPSCGVDRFRRLTADDFWTMSLAHPLVEERDPPTNERHPLPRVPDFPAMLQDNGPWLIAKLDAECRRRTHVSLAEMSVILLEQEAGAEAVATTLGDVLGNLPVRVPRDVLRTWESQSRPSGFFVQALNRGDQWALGIEAIPRPTVAVLDEFSFSGGSLDSLSSLVEACGKQVRFKGGLALLSAREGRDPDLDKAFFLYETSIGTFRATATV